MPIYFWGESVLNAYLIAGVLKYVRKLFTVRISMNIVNRYAVTLHVTWCVNSIVHKWGSKPYQYPPDKLVYNAIKTIDEY